MPFDFDTLTDRRGTGSLKWDVAEGELPMWVADMDFETAPAIIEALRRKVDIGIFGYSVTPEEYYTALQNWWSRRYDFAIEREWLVPTTGVIPTLSSLVRLMAKPGGGVIIQSPVYNCFYSSITNNGRKIVENTLTYIQGRYAIDFEDLETKLADPDNTLLIFCNPHNPIGALWSAEDMARVGELCAEYGVVCVSDEIHCDLTDPGLSYIPFASVSETCRNVSITCISPGKSFNLAGLTTATALIPDEALRERVVKRFHADEIAEPNVFAFDATIAAYTQGEQWLDQLRDYIEGNKRLVRDYVEEHLPDIHLVESEALYLLWLDCRAITSDDRSLNDTIRTKTGLVLSPGSQYGEAGTGFLRMNVATQRERVIDGIGRLRRGIQD